MLINFLACWLLVGRQYSDKRLDDLWLEPLPQTYTLELRKSDITAATQFIVRRNCCKFLRKYIEVMLVQARLSIINFRSLRNTVLKFFPQMEKEMTFDSRFLFLALKFHQICNCKLSVHSVRINGSQDAMMCCRSVLTSVCQFFSNLNEVQTQ